MKRWWTLLFVALVMTWCGWMTNAGRLDAASKAALKKVASNKPLAVFPSPTFDFGERDEGVKVEHAFVVRNEGKAPLLIAKVQPG